MTMPAAVPSPCVDICRMDEASGLCEGCLRTLDEIACWSLLDDGEKQAVCDDLAQRRAASILPGPAGSSRPP